MARRFDAFSPCSLSLGPMSACDSNSLGAYRLSDWLSTQLYWTFEKHDIDQGGEGFVQNTPQGCPFPYWFRHLGESRRNKVVLGHTPEDLVGITHIQLSTASHSSSSFRSLQFSCLESVRHSIPRAEADLYSRIYCTTII